MGTVEVSSSVLDKSTTLNVDQFVSTLKSPTLMTTICTTPTVHMCDFNDNLFSTCSVMAVISGGNTYQIYIYETLAK